MRAVSSTNGNINVPDTITTVRRLFEGHPSLLEGFQQFLPAGYEAAVPAAVAPAAVAPAAVAPAAVAPAAVAPAAVAPAAVAPAAAAIQYLTTVRARFGREGPYRHFLRLLNRYQRGGLAGETQGPALVAVVDSVVTLFRGHADLQRGFLQFLPDVLQEEARARVDRSIEAANAVAPAAEGTVAPLRRTSRKAGPRRPAQGLQARVERVLATYEARHGGAPGDAAGAALALRLQRALDEWREHEGAGVPGAAEAAGAAPAVIAAAGTAAAVEVSVASATVTKA